MRKVMPKGKQMPKSENKPQVVVAPMSQMTRIKDRLDRNGQAIERTIEKPKK